VLRSSGRTVRAVATGDRDFTVRMPVAALLAQATEDDTIADLWMHLVPRDGGAEDGPHDRDDLPAAVRLGGFERTLRHAVPGGVDDATLVVTDLGNLSVSLPGTEPRKITMVVERLAFGDARIELEAELRSPERLVRDARLVVVARESGARHHFAPDLVDLEGKAQAERGRSAQRLTVSVDVIDLTSLLRDDDETLDLWVEVDAQDGSTQDFRLRAGEHSGGLETATARSGDDVVQLVPYATFRGSNVSVHVERMTASAHASLRRWTRMAWLLPLVRPFLGIWLVGELPYKAQDNGMHFFRWVREHRPRRRAYYVIQDGAPDMERVAPSGNVVLRHSREHIRVAFLAHRIVSTHHAEYLLPSRSPAVVRGVRGVRVFLQHGVMGTKNMVANYGRLAPGFATDRFHVSSVREQEMIVNDFGFRPRQVRVTGLPRTDQLLAPAEAAPSGVLVIPTWREWLGTPQACEAREYRERWLDFLAQPRLQEAMADGLAVTVILHPNMRRFSDAFDLPGVRLVKQGETDVQTLMREHACLVTDYSSVAFDFAFQSRPVLYFQFDRARFIGRRGSHLDLENDLPGTIAFRADELAEHLVRVADGGFVMSDEHRRRVDRLLTHPDRHNNERVEASVKSAGGPLVHWWRLLDSPRVQDAFLTFRSGKSYPRAMAALMAVARALPRKRTVVFESGNGRQYGDSPRALYEELSRRDVDLRSVWSTSSTFRPLDPSTRKVMPRSPAYYWELGRAKVWVNNQNFPIAVRPARRTYYLQTWHGTPLKRMQHDAVSTMGRSEGYLDRVTRMTGYWDALLSPSPTATERFRSAFRFDGPVIEEGYPRNDILASAEIDDVARLVKRRLGLDPDVRLILFAPTFRDDEKIGSRFVFNPHVDFEELAEHLPDGAVLGVRKHGIIRQAVKIPEAVGDRVIDLSSYPDVQDLLAAADVLITDYSSLMFDYALKRRPILLYCYDIESYRDELRGFYADFESEAPGPILRTDKDLFRALGALDEVLAAYAPNLERFASTYGPKDDGNAAARVVDELLRAAE
jgi:CDP-glycerol glycerophosphotransferase